MRHLAIAAVLAAAVSGCASIPPDARRNPADPFERVNRGVFAFNDTLDNLFAKPVAIAYDNFVPDLVKIHVGNFFSNLGDVLIAANNLLQGKPKLAASDAGRVVVNTLFGFGGIVDIASDLGLVKHREDFGQTLGRWGLESGPYLVLPILGPSTVRDAGGAAVDFLGSPIRQFSPESARWQLTATNLVDQRQRLLGTERALEGLAFDRYSFLRDAYLQRRRSLVFDGQLPEERDEPADPYRDEDEAADAAAARPPAAPAAR